MAEYRQCPRETWCGRDAGHEGPCRTLAQRFGDALVKLAIKWLAPKEKP